MIMSYMRSLLLAILAVLCLNVSAADIDAAAARAVAGGFLQSAASGKLMSSPAPLRLAYVKHSAQFADKADYYVFNASDGDAFVIVSGDDRAIEVLGYGKGNLDMDNIPCNMQWMLDHYSKQMDWLRTHPDAELKPRSASMPTGIVRPLLPSTWSQSEPYWNKCPVYKGHHCVTGCIATSMAQVMYYWKYPDELPDLEGYDLYGISVTDLPPVTLDWDNMLDGYALTYTPAQADAVATLMRYCGQASYMMYSPAESGAYIYNQFLAMQLFGYSMSSQVLHRDNYDAETWTNLIYEDLAAGFPVLYVGNSEDSGHSFVLDGYRYGTFHINWGWEGAYDNYFVLDAFEPTQGYGFIYEQEMIHDLYPFQFGGSLVPYEFEVDGICYKRRGDGLMVTPRAFSGRSYSAGVNIPAEVSVDGQTYPVTAIADGAFRNCASLTSVTIPGTVNSIGNYAFKNCTALTAISIPSSVKRIGYGAFMDCNSLKSVNMVAGLEEIGYYAFAYCDRLGNVNIPNTVTSMGDGAFYLSGVKKVDTGNGLDTVNYCAFIYCPLLTDVTIGDGVKVIKTGAFYGCPQLETVTIGSGIDSIGAMAFKDSPKITSIIMRAEWPPVVYDSESFDPANYNQATLYVLDDFTMEGYICAEIWCDFKHFALIDELVHAIAGDVNADGEVTVADVNAIVQSILSGVPDNLADVNHDGEIGIADINAVIDLILGH